MMMYGSCLLLRWCVSFNVFACGVCGNVWCVVLCCVIVVCVCVCVLFHVFVGFVCDLLCGDVWFGCVCVVFVCVCPFFKHVLFVIDCVMLHGMFLCELFNACVCSKRLCVFACELMCGVVCFVLL